MNRWIGFTLAAALAVTLPQALHAQEEEGGDLVQVVTFKVHPPDIGTWYEAVGTIVEAAEAAELAPEFGWAFYNAGPFRFVLVGEVGSMAEFDDPDAWVGQFQGTPGEETLMQAFEMLSTVQYRQTNGRVDEHVPAWSYESDMDMSTMTGAHVTEVWIQPGHEEEFGAIVEDYMGFLAEMGYAYPVWGHKPRVGGTGEHTFVTGIDSREHYYGKNSLERIAEVQGAAGRLEEYMQRFSAVMLDIEVYDAEYLPALSYEESSE